MPYPHGRPKARCKDRSYRRTAKNRVTVIEGEVKILEVPVFAGLDED